MQVIPRNTISFLKQLKLNNNRDWFNENKEQFIHMVSEQITAKFHNDCKEVTWFF